MKLTLDDLIAKKSTITERKSIDVYIPSLDGEITINELPPRRFMSFINGDMSDTVNSYDAQIELIYASCPILHEKTLQDAYDCHEPTEVVEKLLKMGGIKLVMDKILELYDLDTISENVKN